MTRLIKLTDSIQETLLWYVCILLSCASIYAYAENKSLMDALWWACVTATTVGYGDLYPVTLVGRLNAMVLMHVVPLFIIPLIVAHILDKMKVDEHKFTHSEQEEILEFVRKR